MNREAGAEASVQWQPFATVPRDGRAVLVWLEEPLLHSRVAVASFHPNVGCIGGLFEFDAPKPTHWALEPEGPK